MEPSGDWLRTKAEGRRKVREGHVNFATQLNHFMLVFAIRKYLLREGEGFYIMISSDSARLCMGIGLVSGFDKGDDYDDKYEYHSFEVFSVVCAGAEMLRGATCQLLPLLPFRLMFISPKALRAADS